MYNVSLVAHAFFSGRPLSDKVFAFADIAGQKRGGAAYFAASLA